MASTNSKALKDALLESLSGVVNSDSNIRRNAEEQMKLIEVTNDYGIHLAEISLDQSINWPLRQLASVLLKQYIDTHWDRNSSAFQEPEIESDAKERIKCLLLDGLGKASTQHIEENSYAKKLLSSLAYAISSFARFEWSNNWPDIFNKLLAYLSSNNMNSIYGAMKVFNEISHEIIDTQIPMVAPVLLPKMLEILSNEDKYTISTRSRAVQIFTIIAEIIAVTSEYNKTLIKNYLDPILPQFIENLVKILEKDQQQIESKQKIVFNENDYCLKKSVLQSLTMLIKSCRKRILRWMPQILSIIWFNLVKFATSYLKTIVNYDSEQLSNDISNGQSNVYVDDGDNDTENGGHCDFDNIYTNGNDIDSDGEIPCLENLIFSIFDFITILIETSKSRKLIKQGLTDLIYYILLYMQITDEQIQTWQLNLDRFIEDEEEESYSYTVRQSSLEILLSLAREYEENEYKKEMEYFQLALINAIKRIFNESNHLRLNNQNNRYWWKLQESGIYALGSLSLMILDTINANSQLSAEYKQILDDILTNIEQSQSPFYYGRCLWVAARYAPIMNQTVIDRFLQITVNGLNNQSPIIKIYALRSAYNFCVHLKDNNQINLIRPYLQQLIETSVEIGLKHSTEVLGLALETIAILISVDKSFTVTLEHRVCPLAIATFLRHSSDPVLIASVQDIFKVLSRNEQCIGQLQQRIIPTLVSILHPTQLTQNVQTLQPVAIDILTTVVRNSVPPLSDGLIAQAFPALISCILSTTDETATLQNGAECLRAYISKGSTQVAAYREHETGRDGMSLVMQVCLHILDPHMNENSATMIGKLIFIIITKASQFIGNDNIHLLLRSVLSKLQTSESLTVVQGLIMVFAHLINHHLATVLDFLSSLPGPSGSKSALEFVLNLWLSRQHLFYGAYENKVSIMALCKLLEHSIVNSDGQMDEKLNLNLIRVPGDPIISTSNCIMTRAKAAEMNSTDQWTIIPCSVKILKLLIHELDNIGTIGEDGCDEDEDEDEDEDDEDSDSEGENENTEVDQHGSYMSGHENTSGLCSNNSESLAAATAAFDEIVSQLATEEEDEDEDDDDKLNDPINKIDLSEHLLTFLRSFVATPYVNQFAEQLTDLEKNILHKYSQ